MSDENAILCCFKCFLGCLRPNLISFEGIDVKIACVKDTRAKSACFGDDSCTGSACAKGVCAGVACIRGAYIWVTCIQRTFATGASDRKASVESACIKTTYTKITFIRNVGIINCLEIHLQSFQIFKVG